MPLSERICSEIANAITFQSIREQKPEKPKGFTCEFCQKKFANIFNLNRHLKVHTGEKNHGKIFQLPLMDSWLVSLQLVQFAVDPSSKSRTCNVTKPHTALNWQFLAATTAVANDSRQWRTCVIICSFTAKKDPSSASSATKHSREKNYSKTMRHFTSPSRLSTAWSAVSWSIR